jgi:hypothetical protein
MGYNIIIASCGAQQLYTLYYNDGKSSNAHTGDGQTVTAAAAVWARQRPCTRRDRDGTSEKYLVVPLMETVPT